MSPAPAPASPQEVVERALAASRADGCVVIVEEVSQAEVRFANNTTTTNGVRRNRRVAVVSFRAVAGAATGRPGARGRAVGGAGGSGEVGVAGLGVGPTAVGVASGSGDGRRGVLVRASEAEASGAGPAEDASALVEPGGRAAGRRTDGGAGSTSRRCRPLRPCSAASSPDSGDAFDRARAAGNRLAGFATHGVETVYLGTSTGLRLRHVQPAGTMELVARSADGSRSVWAGSGHLDLRRHRRARLRGTPRPAPGVGPAHASSSPPGATRCSCPPTPPRTSWWRCRRPCRVGTRRRAAVPSRLRGEAPRSVNRCARCPSSCAATPAEAGLESAPFLVTGASGTDVSVFDNGLPIGPTSWIEGGRLRRLRYHRAGRGALGCRALARRSAT